MRKSIRRCTAEKELRLAMGYVRTKEAYEAAGATFMGTLGMAAKAGYFTPAGCERLHAPVTDEEWANIQYFAMFADSFQDQTIMVDGQKRRPCLPVFFRKADV